MKQEDYFYIDGLICKYLSGEIDSAELMQLKKLGGRIARKPKKLCS